MPAKLDRCVADVKGDKGVDNAYAVCNASIKESEDDICLNCGEPRSQHGLFTNHKFEEDVEEFEDDDDIVITISVGETTDKGPKPMPPVNIVEQSPLYDKGLYNEGGPGSGRKSTGAHGVVPGQLPPAKTPKAKPTKPSSAITPMGKGKTSTSATRVNESHNPLDIPFGREVPGDSISDGLDEAVAIGGGLSAVSIGGKKKLEECLPCQQFDAVHKALTKKASHVRS